jgi:sugar lactone lactonase YvrE
VGSHLPAGAVRRATLWSAFWNSVALSALPVALVCAYLFFWPVELAPAAWFPGFGPDLSGPYVANDEIARSRLLSVHWVEPHRRESQRYLGMGPETVAEGKDGWLYTGLCDAERAAEGETQPRCNAGSDAQGWVVRVDPRTRQVERYVQTGGRPLGLAFDGQGRLYIADGTQGLLRVDAPVQAQDAAASSAVATGNAAAPATGAIYARRVANCELPEDVRPSPRGPVQAPRVARASEKYGSPPEFEGRPGPQPDYTDSVAIGHDPLTGAEEVWFTCPSQRWPLSAIQLDGLESRGTGRVLRYEPCASVDPLSCRKTLAAAGLMFANGIAVSDAAGAVWVSEWYGYRIVELSPPTSGGREQRWGARTFVDNLPGYPDNLSLDPDGTLWVGLVIRRFPLVDRFHPYSFLKKTLARLPGSVLAAPHAFALGLDRAGRVTRNLQDATGFFDQVTGVYPVGDALYFASNTTQALACLPRRGLTPGSNPCDAWAGHRSYPTSDPPPATRSAVSGWQALAPGAQVP